VLTLNRVPKELDMMTTPGGIYVSLLRRLAAYQNRAASAPIIQNMHSA